MKTLTAEERLFIIKKKAQYSKYQFEILTKQEYYDLIFTTLEFEVFNVKCKLKKVIKQLKKIIKWKI